jgi:hypothetical protein
LAFSSNMLFSFSSHNLLRKEVCILLSLNNPGIRKLKLLR